MAKENSFWQEHEATLKPLIGCAVFLVLLAGFYFTVEKYSQKKYERGQKEKSAVVDTVKQVKDTVTATTVQLQR